MYALHEMKDLLNIEEENNWIKKQNTNKKKKEMMNDRFIPCRKESKLQVMLSNAHQEYD